MNIYDIEYTNNNLQGAATVEAASPYKASVFLQSTGRLNATRYKVISIKSIGCNSSTVERILRETYQEKIEPTPTPGGCECKFDINSLSKKDIQNLKLKINEQTGTIYVNRITGYIRFNRPNANDGYSYFLTDGNESRVKAGLYVKKNGENVYLGLPFKYKHVESHYRIVDLRPEMVSPPFKGQRFTVRNKYPKNLGIFIKRRNAHSGSHWVLLTNIPTYMLKYYLNDRKKLKNYVFQLTRDKLKSGAWKSPFRQRVTYLLTHTDDSTSESKPYYVTRIAIGEIKRRNLAKSIELENCTYRLKGLPIVEHTFTYLKEKVLQDL